MSDLLERIVVPVAVESDAVATVKALRGVDVGDVLAVDVTEKDDGGIDMAGVEQRELAAKKAFEGLRAVIGVDVETELQYGTDVATEIFAAVADHSATTNVFTPSAGSRWAQFLTGDVALDLITDTDRPEVVLPDVGMGD